MSYTQERATAIEAVTRAAKLCMAVRDDMVNNEALEKGDRSPVTVADFGAQALVCQHLKDVFPDDVIVGEEDSAELKQSNEMLEKVTSYVQKQLADADADSVCNWIDAGNGSVADRFWTLDPIDGTKGFLRNDQYAIALALVEGGQVKVGALVCPALPLDLDDENSPVGTVFIAVRGEGAMMGHLGSDDFTEISVTKDPSGASVRFVESVESGHGDQSRQEAVAKAAGITNPSLRMDSQAKYGAVARGNAALYLRLPSPKSPNYREKIWDHAAGLIVVEEAGGRVTDMTGTPLDLASDYKMHDNRGVVASNGVIHDAVIEVLAQDS